FALRLVRRLVPALAAVRPRGAGRPARPGPGLAGPRPLLRGRGRRPAVAEPRRSPARRVPARAAGGGDRDGGTRGAGAPPELAALGPPRHPGEVTRHALPLLPAAGARLQGRDGPRGPTAAHLPPARLRRPRRADPLRPRLRPLPAGPGQPDRLLRPRQDHVRP